MTSINPANVPLPDDVRWELARREQATARQVHALKDLAFLEGIDLAGLYGDGYTTPDELSKWAAHWGIDVLESRMKARAYEEARRAVAERNDRIAKSVAASYYRAKFPGKYPVTLGGFDDA